LLNVNAVQQNRLLRSKDTNYSEPQLGRRRWLMEGFESIRRLWRAQNIHYAIPGIQLERGLKCRKCRAR